MLKNKSKKPAKKNRQEINEESRELKRKRKHKGLPSGSRFSDTENNRNNQKSKAGNDPRIGSKKPIALVITEQPIKSSIKTPVQKAPTLPPEQELEQLENDPRLEQLLDLVEQDSKLTKEQQTYLDTKLQRIDELMLQLGYNDTEFDDESDDELNTKDEKPEDIISLLKRK